MFYDLIASLGPATEAPDTLKTLRDAGVTGFRLNTSHLSLQDLGRWRERLHKLFGQPLPMPLTLDLQGSKWRLGDFRAFVLREGRPVELILGRQAHQPGVLPVPHPDFFQAVRSCPGEIVLNDAKSALRIASACSDRIRATIVKGGEIAPNKGITLPGSEYRKESLSEKDTQIFAESREWPAVRYALSYVRDAVEMASYRTIFGPTYHLIAKLERAPALEDVPGIAQRADELWLCRGDLGAEMGPRAMAEAVHRFSGNLDSCRRPVLLAGQVMEHMVEYASPTRSEICYLLEALTAGFRGIVLSDETAIGRYPLEACRAAALFR